LLKLEIYLFYQSYPIRFDERNMYNVKNCDLDLSVDWFKLSS